MTETLTVATVETQKRVTIKRGEYGRWYVTIEGNGYPVDFNVESVDLVKIRDAGYVIHDPHGWCDLYGPKALQEAECSQAAMDADSAGYPSGVAFYGMHSDNGHDLSLEEE